MIAARTAASAHPGPLRKIAFAYAAIAGPPTPMLNFSEQHHLVQLRFRWRSFERQAGRPGPTKLRRMRYRSLKPVCQVPQKALYSTAAQRNKGQHSCCPSPVKVSQVRSGTTSGASHDASHHASRKQDGASPSHKRACASHKPDGANRRHKQDDASRNHASPSHRQDGASHNHASPSHKRACASHHANRNGRANTPS